MYISVIVPLYKGKRFVPNIIAQLRECQNRLADDVVIELILSNDYPDEIITLPDTQTGLSIIVLNSKVNLGIHGARVKGLQTAQGEYILFLDQDDRIDGDYFNYQLEVIGDSDAVICGCIHGKKIFYDEFRPMKAVLTKEKIIGEYNYIVSPGQVLIRRQAIPKAWLENVLTANGADDWFLWILLFDRCKKIEINEKNLFEHTVDEEGNASFNTWRMYSSEREVLQIIKEKQLLSNNQIVALENAVKNMLRLYLNDLDKMKREFNICNCWLQRIYEKDDIGDRLKREEIHNVAIYGCNEIARNLCRALEKQRVDVLYFIDRNAQYLSEVKPVYTMEDNLQSVDGVIIALVQYEEDITEQLKAVGFSRIFTIGQLVK